MRKLLIYRAFEITIGPLPATILVVPMVLGVTLGNLFALYAWLTGPDEAGSTIAILGILELLAWSFASLLGVIALWVAVLLPTPPVSTRARVLLLGGLMLGLYGAIRFISVILNRELEGMFDSILLWLLLLAGPVLIGLVHSYSLVRLLLRKESQG